MTGSAGLVVNPDASRDVRRLTSLARTIDVHERVHTTSRILLGLGAAGVRRVLYMPEPARVVERALDPLSATGLLPDPGTRPEVLPVQLQDRVAVDAGGTSAAAAVRDWRLVPGGRAVTLSPGPATLALDGERQIVLEPGRHAEVRLVTGGPWLLDVRSLLERAALEGRFSPGPSPSP